MISREAFTTCILWPRERWLAETCVYYGVLSFPGCIPIVPCNAVYWTKISRYRDTVYRNRWATYTLSFIIHNLIANRLAASQYTAGFTTQSASQYIHYLIANTLSTSQYISVWQLCRLDIHWFSSELWGWTTVFGWTDQIRLHFQITDWNRIVHVGYLWVIFGAIGIGLFVQAMVWRSGWFSQITNRICLVVCGAGLSSNIISNMLSLNIFLSHIPIRGKARIEPCYSPGVGALDLGSC